MARNFSAGWNDPPKLDCSYLNGRTSGGAPITRDMFAKRVGFPVNTTQCDNRCYPEPRQSHDAHSQSNHCSSPRGSLMPERVLRSASSPCFQNEASTGLDFTVLNSQPSIRWPPNNEPQQLTAQISTIQYMKVNSLTKDEPNETQSDQTIALSSAEHLSNEEIMRSVRNAFLSCQNLAQNSFNNIERRLTTLQMSLNNDSLSQPCRLKLSRLIENMRLGDFKEAYDAHSLMMVDHFAEETSDE